MHLLQARRQACRLKIEPTTLQYACKVSGSPRRSASIPKNVAASKEYVSISNWVSAVYLKRPKENNLAASLDYDRVVAITKRVVSSRHFDLVESLADTISRELLTLATVQHVKLTVLKTECIPEADGAGVTIVCRRRPSLAAIDFPEAKANLESGVLIIGGGPAGLAAANWVARFGGTSVLIERDTIGGQLGLIHRPLGGFAGLTKQTAGQAPR